MTTYDGTIVGPDDYLVIRSDRMTDQDADYMRNDIATNLPGLVGRVLIVEAERADVYVVKPAEPCGCENRDGTAPECAPKIQVTGPMTHAAVNTATGAFQFGTYPGHDPGVTVGACRPTHPCPACVTRLSSLKSTDGSETF